MLREARFSGPLTGAGTESTLARPGQWPIYVAIFGGIGRHPLAIYAVQVTVRGAVVVALFLLFRNYLSPQRAAGVAAIWALFPNATALEYWASGLHITVSLLLLVLGAHRLTRAVDDGKAGIDALVLLTASMLVYEATAPAAALIVVLVPILRGKLRWKSVALGWALLGAAGLWIVAHWNPSKPVLRSSSDLYPVLDAHFGWGVFPSGSVATAALLVALAGTALAVGRLALPSLRSGSGAPEWLVLIGLAIIVVGTVPFARYFYEPLGVGDRANVVSSVGASMAWVGFGLLLLRWRVALATAGVVFALLTVPVRLDRADSYAAAGAHVLDILDATDEAIPHPSGPIVLGPSPWVRGNVAGILDESAVDAALQLHRGDLSVHGRSAFTDADFLRAPPELRLDLRTLRTYPPGRGSYADMLLRFRRPSAVRD